MNRKERRAEQQKVAEKQRKAAEFVARMNAAKDVKQVAAKVAALLPRLVVQRAIVFPDAHALALVAQHNAKMAKQARKSAGTTARSPR